MSKWNLIFDAKLCTSCNNCVLATKDEYLENKWEGYSAPAPKHGDLWFTLERHERGKIPMIDVTHYTDTCHQCDNAHCVDSDKTGAITKRKDGIVVIDPVKAKGNRDLVSTCPFGKIYWNEEEQVAQKWSFDAHLLDSGWAEPRCTQICPTEALKAVKLSDREMEIRAKQEGLTHLSSTVKAKPRTWYKNIEPLTSCFLGGTVAQTRDGTERCIEDQTIELTLDGSVIATQKTDIFGDFKFETLKGKGETYCLRILSEDGSEVLTQDVPLSGNRFLGVVEI